MSATTARVATASPAFVERATPAQLDDWLAYFEPDVVVLTGESGGVAREPTATERRAANALRRALDPGTLFFHPGEQRTATGTAVIDGVQFVFAHDHDQLGTVEVAEEFDATEPTYVLSDLLALDIDRTALSTTLVGGEAYREALGSGTVGEHTVHLSTCLPAEYRRDWEGLTVFGGGVEAGEGDTPLPALDCRSDGRVLTRELRPTRLGLRALDGVGHKRARLLRDAGFASRADIADAEPSRLAETPGIGHSTATRLVESAAAIAEERIVRQSDRQLPNGEPVYIDIETDGLSPTITWLIGVLDGSAADGTYMAFLQRDPDEPGRAIEDFMTWYTANASHRPLVAYHGWNFDFTVLYDHIVEYCPQYESAWNSSYRFDPYQWAITENNAVLPGQTNKLEDVAGALGYERSGTGLTGAAVARAYRAWMADRSPATELDWDRFERYCEDDVRALAVVYEALEASGRIESTETTSPDHEKTTTQGTLSEW